MRTKRIFGLLLVAAHTSLLTSCGGSPDERTPYGSEGAGDVLNQFPQDAHTGPVPQARGLDDRPPAQAALSGAQGASAALTAAPATTSTLVLYDDDGPYGWLGELYGIAAGHLASHFGTWRAKPIAQYQAGDLFNYTAAIYIGSTYDAPVPVAFLDDVLANARPVVWTYDNIWQLANRSTNFVGTYGFDPWYFDFSAVEQVVYKGTALARYSANGGGIMVHGSLDDAKANVLATAVRPDGSTFPWAVRAQNLTYIGENPLAFIFERDRYLAFCDLLFDALAPATPARHRALVRIEDVTPRSNPTALKKIADYLASQGVPFSVAVVPYYRDPRGVYNGGVPQALGLRQRPTLVSALKYMISKRGTLVMHGYTHQYSNVNNPYTGASADDFEFWLAHVDSSGSVVGDGPVPEDSSTWASARIASGLAEFNAAGLPRPLIFEFPHYAGSGVDARAIRSSFGVAYHRGLYFKGALTGLPDDTSGSIGQFFPYTVTDVYGWKAIPENIGNYEPLAQNNNPPRLPADLIASARAHLVVRDGVASFFFHPYYPLSALKQIVSGLKAAGYTFVAPSSL